MKNKPSYSSDSGKFYIAIIAFLIWMVITTVFYFTYPFPNDKGTFFNFIIIFFREIIIAGLLICVLVLAIFKKIHKMYNDKNINNGN